LHGACGSKHHGGVAGISDKGWDLGDYLREQREHARLSLRQLASLAGVSNPYLSQVERGLRKPSAEVLQQIARGLRISAEALYVRAGILDSEGRPDVEAAINTDPDLNDRQRRVLLDIYASFRAETRRSGEQRRAETRRPADAPDGPAAREASDEAPDGPAMRRTADGGVPSAADATPGEGR
jgi:transcriptional regulator with XRE-family HTH domain